MIMDWFSYYCEILGNNIKDIRAAIKPPISQEVLSEKAGMSLRTYQLIENAGGNPELKTIVNVATILETPLWKLFISYDSGPQTSEHLLTALTDLQKENDQLKHEITDLKRRLAKPPKKKR